PDAKQWEESILAEYQALVDTGTFEVVDLPLDRAAIPSTYMFKEKTDADGRTIKFKTRIVVRSNFQKKGIDFNSVFAPIPRLDTVHAVFSLTASLDWDIDQLDFKSAFLNGDLKDKVYLKPPEGFPIDLTLYGLRQSPFCWNKKLTGVLKEFTLVRSEADFSVYIGIFGDNIVILLTHVDDMALTGNNRSKINKIKRFIQKHFNIKDLGKLNFYLAIKWLPHTPIVEQFSDSDSSAENSEEQLYMKKVPYVKAIGSLINPGTKQWEGVKRVLHYLKGTLDFLITLSGHYNRNPILSAYFNALFQDCPDTSRSTSSYIFYLSNAPISWSPKRQPVVTVSTMEAEYIGLSNATRQAIWLRSLLKDLQCAQVAPTPIYGDTNASLILRQDANDHSHTKHIKRTFHFVRKHIQLENNITVDYCPDISDIFTKPLNTVLFSRFLSHLLSAHPVLLNPHEWECHR
ncbi:hypothetical protein FRB90_011743, partial [Tulasnella sp. 427]